MTKKEIFDLIKKFSEDGTSESENKILFDWYEKSQSNNVMESWDLSEEEEAKTKLLERICKTLRETESIKRPRRIRRNWKVAAAIVAVICSSTLFYVQNGRDAKLSIPRDAITLKLGDGTIQIIQEQGTTTVKDKKGHTIGSQQQNKLIYKKTQSPKEFEYNTLNVPYGKRFELQLSDGTIAHLNAGSRLKYPVQFLKATERKIYLEGEAYLEVTEDAQRPFIVAVNELNIRVLGTQFNVCAYPEDAVSEVVLVEGSVGLYTEEENFDLSKSEMLSPGNRASFYKKSRRFVQDEVHTDIYTSWRNGELVFRNMPFKTIIRKMERHYDVTIENNNAELANTIFNASFGNEPLATVLKSIKKIYGIEYQLNKDKVIIN